MAVLLYDGRCRMCGRQASHLARITGDRLVLQSFHEPGVLERYPQLSYEECMREMKVVLAEGRVVGGAAAVTAALSLSPRWRWLSALLHTPGMRALAGVAYGVIARNRYRLAAEPCPDGTCPLHRGPAAPAAGEVDGLQPTAHLFLKALGVVYLIAFASLAVQAHVLMGAEGLLPVRELLAEHRGDGLHRFWRLPTLFWLWDGDLAVRAGALLGLGLAGGLAWGWRMKWCLVGCWLLFLSYVTAGRDFFWFQWDNLLLEATAPALLLPTGRARSPHPWLIFLFRWLLFRLLFESGLAKVQQGAQSWYPLMAMAWYYETAPLPSLGGWYAHQLPLSAHRLAAALTLLGELLVPLLIWGRRGARRLAFVLIVGFQVVIQATANYGYFNLLAIVIALFLLDRHDLRRLPAWLGGHPVSQGSTPPPGRPSLSRPLVALAAAAIFLLTLLELAVLVAGQGVAQSPSLVAVRELVLPFRVASKYHLFAHIDPRRVEAEIEWTADGQEWRPYQLRYKPGPLDRHPPVVAPHQPRVDFQLWFFSLGRDGGAHAYFNTLVRRLCSRSEPVEALFVPASLPDRPPTILRVAFYRYRMTDRATLAREGRYWSRELLGYHPAAHFCDSSTPPRF